MAEALIRDESGCSLTTAITRRWCARHLGPYCAPAGAGKPTMRECSRAYATSKFAAREIRREISGADGIRETISAANDDSRKSPVKAARDAPRLEPGGGVRLVDHVGSAVIDAVATSVAR